MISMNWEKNAVSPSIEHIHGNDHASPRATGIDLRVYTCSTESNDLIPHINRWVIKLTQALGQKQTNTQYILYFYHAA